MTDPIAVDLPAKPAFSRSVPPAPVTPAPLTAVPKTDTSAKSAPATTPVPLAEEVKQTVTPLPIGPTPAPTPATGFFSRFTKKQLTIGASAIVSLVAGIGGVRVLFPSEDETETSVVTKKFVETATALVDTKKAPPPSGAPLPPPDQGRNSNLNQFLPKPNIPDPYAPSDPLPGAGGTLKPTGIQPVGATTPPLPVVETKPSLPAIPAPDFPAIPAPSGLAPAGGTAPALPIPPSVTPTPPLPLPGTPALPTPPVTPPGGMTPPVIVPDKPSGIPPVPPPGGVAPVVPLPPSGVAPAAPKLPDPAFPPLPAPGGVAPPVTPPGAPKLPDPAFPPLPAPGGVAPPVTPPLPAPGGVAPPVTPPSVFPVPADPKNEVKFPPPPTFDSPGGFGTPTTFTKPAGTPEVKPNVTEFAPKTDFDVDLHDPKATDTYESISYEFYNDRKFAAALRAFNKNQPLQGGRFVEVPPIHVLKRKFGADIGANPGVAPPAVTPIGGTGTPSVAPKTPPSTAPEWGAATPRPVANNRGVYIVPQGGLTMAQIARQTLGTDQRWREIYDLNPQFTKPSELLPAGTELRLPADARLP
jgi:hypothetical protein